MDIEKWKSVAIKRTDYDWDGSTIQDSMHFDMYVDTIADVHFTDGLNRKHYPFDKTMATILLEDELECRQLTKEDEYAVNKNNDDNGKL